MSRPRRADEEVEFTWQRRRRWFAWLSMRHAGGIAAGACALFAVLGAVSVSDAERKVHATRASIVSIQRATEAFRADHGRCPGGVAELVHPPEGSAGATAYLAQMRLDAWGREFLFTCPGGNFPASADVVSGGPEGSFGLDRVE